ncbi:MAG: DNA mismatch repair protein MutT [Rhodobacterales bacterium]|nr:MAG: DNA mismatch repair protein MutT [Rhodobacterales bacterium]
MTQTQPTPPVDKSKIIRDAATVILVRDAASDNPRVLMGQRGAKAVFMPNLFVFPGGALDAGDWQVPLAEAGAEPCKSRLDVDAQPGIGPALLAAAVRELWEETGQILGEVADWPGRVPDDWCGFADKGYIPSADGLAFVFRAITPKGAPRRFDARFFAADAERLKTDPDDFSGACDELSNLQWIPFSRVREFDLPFITQVVLAEIQARLPDLSAPETSVPFFDNGAEETLFRRLGGKGPLE